MKKNYTPEFKAQVVREILREQKTMSEIASEYGIHPVQLSQWKKAALDNLAAVFVDERKVTKQQRLQEQEIDRLYARVGKLSTQLEWIKKNVHDSVESQARMKMLRLRSLRAPYYTGVDQISSADFVVVQTP